MQIDSKNRWLIALSAVGIHISIGSIYAYSVIKNPISIELGWNTIDIATAFSIAIFFLGLSASFMGHFVEKYGPSKAGLVATVFYSIGILGTGFALDQSSLYLFYLFYGCISGIGLGIGYIAPVSALMKWFPDKRGLATGLAIMGFGLSALIFGPLMEKLISAFGLVNNFYILAPVYFIIMLASSLYIEKPQELWLERFTAKTNKKIKNDLQELTANEAIKTSRFYMIWAILFINITCGIALISIISPFSQEVIGLTAMQASLMVGGIGLFNGVGRIFWAFLSDKISRANVYILFFCLQIVLFLFLSKTTNVYLFQLMLFIIISCYGGGFSCIAAYLGDIFGTKQIGAIHGYILTAWSAAGIVGPMSVAKIYTLTGSYTCSLKIFSILLFIGLITSIFLKINIMQHKKAINRLI